MRILHVIDNLKLGGTQHLAARTWNQLLEQGHEVVTCVLVSSANEQTGMDRPKELIRLECHGDYRRPFAISAWVKGFSEVMARVKPDVVHSWLWLSDIVAAGAAAKCRVPHVVHLVDRRNWQQSKRLRDRVRRWATRRAFEKAGSRFLAVSKAAAEFAVESLGLDLDRVAVAYNSIHTEVFAAIPDSDAWSGSGRPLRLGIAARIEPEKGHRYLIEAMGLLRTRGIPCTLQITGEGTDRLFLERLVLENNHSDNVQFVGWVDSVAQFLSGIDVFLVPSIDSEGLPTTILEAMAAGRVVIASDVGGASEAISHEKTGFIVKSRDAKAIADAISTISEGRKFAGTVAANARLSVDEKFSMPKMVQTIESMYASVCRRENSSC